jgi:hypothetical protein
MSRILRQRPSPAMVVAFVALCVALAGTASALPGRNRVKRDDIARNAVRTSDITKDAIRTRHIKRRNVTRSKIARRSVDSSLVGTDALVGSNILESSLSKVPDADKLDGLDSSQFARGSKVPTFSLGGGETKQVHTSGPLSLNARCTIGATHVAEILISTSQDNAALDAAVSNPDLDASDADTERRFVFLSVAAGTPAFTRVADGVATAPDGSTIGGSLFAGVNVLGQSGRCVFGGSVTS